MAHPRQTITNPISGERITFVRTDPELVEFDVVFRPLGAPGGAPHRHKPKETIEVEDGRLVGFVAGEGAVQGQAGETIVIPPRRLHFLVNPGPGAARAHVRVEPGMRFDEFLEAMFAVSRGHLKPRELRRALGLLREHW